jgi:phosphoribosylaminoimidazole-succinocarboxamide synthase
VAIVGAPLAEALREKTLAVYSWAAEYARARGIIIADTKMEFGLLPGGPGTTLRNNEDGKEGALILIDELLTPDSSRFWDAQTYKPGSAPPSYDKQYVRDYLEETGWNKEPPAPALPEDVVAKTREKYVDALTKITGQGLQ